MHMVSGRGRAKGAPAVSDHVVCRGVPAIIMGAFADSQHPNTSSLPKSSFWKAVSFQDLEFFLTSLVLITAKTTKTREHSRSPIANISLYLAGTLDLPLWVLSWDCKLDEELQGIREGQLLISDGMLPEKLFLLISSFKIPFSLEDAVVFSKAILPVKQRPKQEIVKQNQDFQFVAIAEGLWYLASEFIGGEIEQDELAVLPELLRDETSEVIPPKLQSLQIGQLCNGLRDLAMEFVDEKVQDGEFFECREFDRDFPGECIVGDIQGLQAAQATAGNIQMNQIGKPTQLPWNSPIIPIPAIARGNYPRKVIPPEIQMPELGELRNPNRERARKVVVVNIQHFKLNQTGEIPVETSTEQAAEDKAKQSIKAMSVGF
nr:Vitamin B12-dependent methionine synthase, activation domain containing protein [Ipomoea batatas]